MQTAATDPFDILVQRGVQHVARGAESVEEDLTSYGRQRHGVGVGSQQHEAAIEVAVCQLVRVLMEQQVVQRDIEALPRRLADGLDVLGQLVLKTARGLDLVRTNGALSNWR